MTAPPSDAQLRAVLDAAPVVRHPSAPDLLETIRWGDLHGRAAPARVFLVEEWLPRSCVTSLYGIGGIGKSLLAQQLGTMVALGRPWLGFATTRAPVLALFSEDDYDELWRRQERINSSFDVGMADLGDWHPAARAGVENVLMTFPSGQPGQATGLLPSIRETARKVGAGLIILDNVAQMFAGDENRRAEATQFGNLLAGLAVATGAAVLLLGHPQKSPADTSSDYSGSTAWNAVVRSRLSLRWEGDGEARKLVLERCKSNYAAPDRVELKWSDGVIRCADPRFQSYGDRLEAETRKGRACQVFLDLLDRLTSQGRNLSHSERAANYAPKIMTRHELAEGLSARELAGAMERLIDDGRIECHRAMPWKGSDRKIVHGVARTHQMLREGDDD